MQVKMLDLKSDHLSRLNELQNSSDIIIETEFKKAFQSGPWLSQDLHKFSNT